MIRQFTLASVIASMLAASAEAETFAYGRFGEVTVYRPSTTPIALAVFLSGDGGWNLGVVSMAQNIANQGALVLGVNYVTLGRALDAIAETSCNDGASEIQTLADSARAKLNLPAGLPVVLIGYSSGATAVYLVQAQAMKGAFAGSIALGFCPDLWGKKPFCAGRSKELIPKTNREGFVYPPVSGGMPGFIALQGMQDQICEPHATIDFIGKVPGARIVMLAKVGHGFGVERNWMPQFLEAYHSLIARKESTLP
jgi:type IV secretory pathway VirJ component